jgi:hypothetical protein
LKALWSPRGKCIKRNELPAFLRDEELWKKDSHRVLVTKDGMKKADVLHEMAVTRKR